MSGNPERDWGLPSWPTQPNRKTVRTPPDASSGKASLQIRLIAAALVGLPAAVLAALVAYLVIGNAR